jgi:type II secretory pathway component PulL
MRRWLASLKTAGLNAQCVLLHVQASVMSEEMGLIAPAAIPAEAHERSATVALEHAAQVQRAAGFG